MTVKLAHGVGFYVWVPALLQFRATFIRGRCSFQLYFILVRVCVWFIVWNFFHLMCAFRALLKFKRCRNPCTYVMIVQRASKVWRFAKIKIWIENETVAGKLNGEKVSSYGNVFLNFCRFKMKDVRENWKCLMNGFNNGCKFLRFRYEFARWIYRLSGS